MQAGWTQGAVERPIMLRSDLVLERPNGVRQLSLVQKGRLVVSGDAATLKGLQGRPCRPGISSLPDQFTRPVSPNQPGAASPGAINPP
jgi:hypothetical protein